MKLTILHSKIGVAGVLVLGFAVSGNVVGQSAAPPAGLPAAGPAPALTPSPAPLPPTPLPPVPAPPRIATPEVLPGAPAPIAPRPGAANPPVALPGVAPAPHPEPTIPGASGAPVVDPTDKSHGHEHHGSSPTPGAGAPPGTDSFKGEYITREWMVSLEFFNDGHGGRKDARAFLEQHGVTFGAGASATIKPDSSTLVLRNTPEQIKVAIGVLARFPGVVLGPYDQPLRRVDGPGGASPLAGAHDRLLEILTPRKPTVARPPMTANPPLVPTPAVPGMGAGSASVPEANKPYGVIRDFPATLIEVGRANLAAELNQDPQAAASRYAAIVANFDAQRQAAATAVYGMGEAYRKMGRNAEARVHYARILREFVDFPELARQSQRQLSITSGAADPEFVGTVGGGGAETSDEEIALLKEELSLLEKGWATTQDRIKAGLAPQSDGLQLQRDILQLKQQLVRLTRGSGRTPSATPPAAHDHDHPEPTPVRR